MIYAIDLHRVTITPACRPREPYKLAFAKTTPHRAFVIEALTMTISELNGRIGRMTDLVDEPELGSLQHDLDCAKLAREIISAAPDYGTPSSPVAVIVAGTQIGTLKFEKEEVWEVEI